MTYRIVVGVDGSPHSNAALRWSLDQALARGGEVTAVFAWQVPFVSIPGAFSRSELEQGYREFLIETVSAVEPAPQVPLEQRAGRVRPDRGPGHRGQGRRRAGAGHPRPHARWPA